MRGLLLVMPPVVVGPLRTKETMGSDEGLIEQIEGLRQHMEALRSHMSDAERQMTEQDHVRTVANMDEKLREARERISRRDVLREQARKYNEAHKNDRRSA